MSQTEFNHLMDSLTALSTEQLRQLRRELDSKLISSANSTGRVNEAQETNQDVQRRLFDAGLLGEIKPPITDLTPYRDRKAIAIEGELLSETVIRERR
jgi:hypothetical protein